MQSKIGICSWSTGRDPRELPHLAREIGVDAVQLALDPLRVQGWSPDEVRGGLAEGGLEIRSGMMSTRGEDYSSLASIRETGGVRLDQHWEENLAAARANAELAQELGLSLVSLHAGFLPERRDDAVRTVMIERLRALVDVFGQHGVRVAFETGQETADTLLDVLDELDRPTAGVNFDPANMILYSMGEPVEALRRLAPRVLQVHIKDARASRTPGEWGSEVVAGTGEVDWRGFFDVLANAELEVDLMIEREAGDQRVADMRAAAALCREQLERFSA